MQQLTKKLTTPYYRRMVVGSWEITTNKVKASVAVTGFGTFIATAYGSQMNGATVNLRKRAVQSSRATVTDPADPADNLFTVYATDVTSRVYDGKTLTLIGTNHATGLGAVVGITTAGNVEVLVAGSAAAQCNAAQVDLSAAPMASLFGLDCVVATAFASATVIVTAGESHSFTFSSALVTAFAHYTGGVMYCSCVSAVGPRALLQNLSSALSPTSKITLTTAVSLSTFTAGVKVLSGGADEKFTKTYVEDDISLTRVSTGLYRVYIPLGYTIVNTEAYISQTALVSLKEVLINWAPYATGGYIEIRYVVSATLTDIPDGSILTVLVGLR